MEANTVESVSVECLGLMTPGCKMFNFLFIYFFLFISLFFVEIKEVKYFNTGTC